MVIDQERKVPRRYTKDLPTNEELMEVVRAATDHMAEGECCGDGDYCLDDDVCTYCSLAKALEAIALKT